MRARCGISQKIYINNLVEQWVNFRSLTDGKFWIYWAETAKIKSFRHGVDGMEVQLGATINTSLERVFQIGTWTQPTMSLGVISDPKS